MFERLKILLPALLLGLLAQLVGAQPAVDWSKQQAETLRHFRALTTGHAVVMGRTEALSCLPSQACAIDQSVI